MTYWLPSVRLRLATVHRHSNWPSSELPLAEPLAAELPLPVLQLAEPSAVLQLLGMQVASCRVSLVLELLLE